jgi:hypothetical protein
MPTNSHLDLPVVVIWHQSFSVNKIMNSADYFGSTSHLLPLALQSNAQYVGLSRYRYHRSLIVSSTRPLRTITYFRFCLHCQPNHIMIPLTMQRRRRQAIAHTSVQHSWDLLRLYTTTIVLTEDFQGRQNWLVVICIEQRLSSMTSSPEERPQQSLGAIRD